MSHEHASPEPEPENVAEEQTGGGRRPSACCGIRCSTLLCGSVATWGHFLLRYESDRSEVMVNKKCQTCYERNILPYHDTPLHDWRNMVCHNASGHPVTDTHPNEIKP